MAQFPLAVVELYGKVKADYTYAEQRKVQRFISIQRTFSFPSIARKILNNYPTQPLNEPFSIPLFALSVKTRKL